MIELDRFKSLVRSNIKTVLTDEQWLQINDIYNLEELMSQTNVAGAVRVINGDIARCGLELLLGRNTAKRERMTDKEGNTYDVDVSRALRAGVITRVWSAVTEFKDGDVFVGRNGFRVVIVREQAFSSKFRYLGHENVCKPYSDLARTEAEVLEHINSHRAICTGNISSAIAQAFEHGVSEFAKRDFDE